MAPIQKSDGGAVDREFVVEANDISLSSLANSYYKSAGFPSPISIQNLISMATICL